MILDEPKDLLSAARINAIKGPEDLPTGFTENAGAMYDYFRSEESSDSARQHWETQLAERENMIRERVGHVPEELGAYYGVPFAVRDGKDELGGIQGENYNKARAKVDELRAQFPELPSDEELLAKIPDAAKAVRERFENVAGRADTFGKIGLIGGGLVGAVRDPLNIASMVVATPSLTGNAISVLSRTLRAAKIGATVSGATELAIQPHVYDFKHQIGVDYSLGDAAANVAFAVAGGAVLFGAGVNIPPLYRSMSRGLSEAYRAKVARGEIAATPEADAAAKIMDTYADIVERNPLSKEPEGQAAHFKAVEKAMNDLRDGRVADVAEIVKGHEPDISIEPRYMHVHTMDDATRRSTEREFLEAQRSRTFDQIYEAAPARQSELENIGRAIEQGIGDGIRFKTKGFKKRETAEARAEEKAKLPGEMKDIVRAGFEVKTPQIADAVVAKLRREFDILDEGYRMTPAGYIDRSLQVRFKDGTVGEVQFWEPNLFKAKNEIGGHDLYKIFRSLETKNKEGPERALKLTKEMRGIYAAALRKADASWSSVLGENADTMASKLARDTTAPFSRTSAGETGVQGAPSRGTENARSEPSGASKAAAGTPSSRTSATALDKSGIIEGTSKDAETIITNRGGLRDDLEASELERILESHGDDLEVPVGVRQSADGKRTEVITRNARELLADTDARIDALKKLTTCLTG